MEWGGADGVQERLGVTAQGLYPEEEVWYGGAPEPRFTAQLADFGGLVPDLPGKLILKTTAPKIELRLAYTELILESAPEPFGPGAYTVSRGDRGPPGAVKDSFPFLVFGFRFLVLSSGF